jgi:hypothetical protein
MSIDTHTLIWLFPIAFMFHDFEEILFWELWLSKNGAEVRNRVPAFLTGQVDAIVGKSTAQFAFPVLLIFSLTVLSSFLAVEYESYGFFLMASGAFFLHGFMHIGQAIALRRYVPAAITSALIAIPYGLILYGRLIHERIVSVPGLLVYFLLSIVLIVPLILIMHKVGDVLYKKAVELLMGQSSD